jgi:hypothetical protein
MSFLAITMAFEVESFGVYPNHAFGLTRITNAATHPQINQLHFSSEYSRPETDTATADISSSAAQDKNRTETAQQIGNLVADDEWDGFGMELSELVTKAVVEDIKRQLRNFTGKENLKVGDLSKEVDRRVKDTVAQMRNKEEYELFDLTLAMDELVKNYTEQLTGKPYEFGDLSKDIDRRIKAQAAEFCGKDTYEFGDVTKEISRRIETRTLEFTGRESYEFGDISREIENRRRQWVKDYLGEEAAKDYEFGDITKKAIADFTGKAPGKYQFGDITKTLLRNAFGDREKDSK